MVKTSQRVAGMSFLNMLGNGVRITLSFATAALASRWLGPQGFGEFSTILAYTTFLNYFFAAGFDNSLAYFVPRYQIDGHYAQINRLLKMGLASSIVLGGVVMLVAVGAAPRILQRVNMEHALWPALILVLQTEFWALSTILGGFLRGLKSFVPVIVKDQLLFPALHLIGLVIALKALNSGLLGYAIGYALATLGSFLYSAYAAAKARRRILSDASKEQRAPTPWREWLGFSLPLGAMSTLEPMLSWVSVIITGFYLSQSDVGKLAVSIRVTVFAYLLLVAITPVFAPYMAELFRSKKTVEFRQFYQTLIYWSSKWALLFAFFLTLAPKQILSIFGASYTDAVTCLLIALIGAFFEGCLGTAKQSLIMCGHNRINLINFSVAILSNVAIGLYTIPKWGLNGAAVAFSLTFAGLNIVRAIQFYKLLGVPPVSWSHLKNLGIIVIVLSLINRLFVYVPIDGILRLVVALALFASGTTAVFWKERDSFFGRLRRATPS